MLSNSLLNVRTGAGLQNPCPQPLNHQTGLGLEKDAGSGEHSGRGSMEGKAVTDPWAWGQRVMPWGWAIQGVRGAVTWEEAVDLPKPRAGWVTG